MAHNISLFKQILHQQNLCVFDMENGNHASLACKALVESSKCMQNGNHASLVKTLAKSIKDMENGNHSAETKEKPESHPMNGGDDSKSYAQNSSYQVLLMSPYHLQNFFLTCSNLLFHHVPFN